MHAIPRHLASVWTPCAASLLAALLLACGAPTPAPTPSGSASVFGPSGALGDGCVIAADCATGFCDRTVPGGYCTTPCRSSPDCPDTGHCAFGYCFRTCTSQRDCRSSEFECFEAAPEIGVCSFDIAAATPDAPNLGAPCRAVAECLAPPGLDAVCIAELDLRGRPSGYPGGACVAVGCGHDADCGEQGRCVPGTMPYCLAACTGDADCRDGYLCDPDVRACRPR